MDYYQFWNEFFKQLFENLPSILSLVASTYAAIKARDASNRCKDLNGNAESIKSVASDIKKYGDYGGYKCPWSNIPVPTYEPKDWEKNIQVNE